GSACGRASGPSSTPSDDTGDSNACSHAAPETIARSNPERRWLADAVSLPELGGGASLVVATSDLLAHLVEGREDVLCRDGPAAERERDQRPRSPVVQPLPRWGPAFLLA